MRALADLGSGCEKDAMGYEVEKWSKAYFNEKVNCDVVDNNLAETFNGWILEARCKSIISMLEDIRRKVMKRLVKKKQESTKWHCDVSPRVLSKLEKNKEKSFDWMAEWNGYNEYEVSSVYNGVDKHKVDMKARTCSCREWNLTGIPCPRSICTIYHQSKTPEDFVAHWYHKETYIKAYKHIMGVVSGKNFWPETDGIRIEPPMFKKMPGRPKKNRRKDKDEPRKIKDNKLSREGRVITCRICYSKGHNKRTCPFRANNVENVQQKSQGNTQGNAELTERNHNKDVQVTKKKRTTPHSGCKGFGVCYSKNGAVTWQTFGKRPRYLYGGVWKQVNSVPPIETSTPTTAPMQSLYTHSKTKDL